METGFQCVQNLVKIVLFWLFFALGPILLVCQAAARQYIPIEWKFDMKEFIVDLRWHAIFHPGR